jgi:hypothetical protein
MMPVYCYTTKEGVTIDRVFSMGKAPKRVRVGPRRWAARDIVAEHRGFKNTPGNWPMEGSFASTIHPDQHGQYAEAMKKAGVPTNYVPEKSGLLAPVFRSRGHRRRYAEVVGHYDRDGGYGDAQRP